MFTLKIIIEIAVVLLIAYGIWHEDELVEMEDKLLRLIKKPYNKLYSYYIETLRRSLH